MQTRNIKLILYKNEPLDSIILLQESLDEIHLLE